MIEADPIASSRDLREAGFDVGVVQAITPWAQAGIRYDRYNADRDASEREGVTLVQTNEIFSTLALMVAARRGTGRLMVEYDVNRNPYGRADNGTPTTLAADRLTDPCPGGVLDALPPVARARRRLQRREPRARLRRGPANSRRAVPARRIPRRRRWPAGRSTSSRRTATVVDRPAARAADRALRSGRARRDPRRRRRVRARGSYRSVRPMSPTPGEPQLAQTYGLADDTPIGPLTLEIAATDADGAIGAPAELEIVADDQPPPINGACSPTGPCPLGQACVSDVCTASLMVSLVWDSTADLDLHVVDPLGGEAYSANPNTWQMPRAGQRATRSERVQDRRHPRSRRERDCSPRRTARRRRELAGAGAERDVRRARRAGRDVRGRERELVRRRVCRGWFGDRRGARRVDARTTSATARTARVAASPR